MDQPLHSSTSKTTIPDIRDRASWTVTQIPRTEEGQRFYYDVYRPFRLKMLKKAPHAFSSTLARETAFSKETWLQRFTNPSVKIYIAVLQDPSSSFSSSSITNPLSLQSQNIISSLTLRGPFPHAHELSATTTKAGDNSNSSPAQQPPPEISRPPHGSHQWEWEWEINAVFTDSSYRRMGIASAVLDATLKETQDLQEETARRSGSHGGCLVKVGVLKGNEEAKTLYEKKGFVIVKEDGEGWELGKGFLE